MENVSGVSLVMDAPSSCLGRTTTHSDAGHSSAIPSVCVDDGLLYTGPDLEGCCWCRLNGLWMQAQPMAL